MRTSNSSESAGFSTLEAIVALSILSILGGLLILMTQTAIRSQESTHTLSDTAYELVRLDDALSKAAERIAIPYWDRQIGITAINGNILIPYFDGSMEKSLIISCVDGRLIIRTPEKILTFSNIDGISFKPLINSEKCLCGIRIFIASGNTAQEFIAPFASKILPEYR